MCYIHSVLYKKKFKAYLLFFFFLHPYNFTFLWNSLWDLVHTALGLVLFLAMVDVVAWLTASPPTAVCPKLSEGDTFLFRPE